MIYMRTVPSKIRSIRCYVLVFRLQDVAKTDRKSLKLNHLLQPYHKSEANSGTVLVFLSIHTIIRKVFRRFSEICEKFTHVRHMIAMVTVGLQILTRDTNSKLNFLPKGHST